MTSNIIVTKIPVSKKGQRNFFQVTIPADVAAITGIQTGITGIAGLDWEVRLPDKQVAGMLRLQADTRANLCYCAQLTRGVGSMEKTMTGFDGAQPDLTALFTFPNTASTFDNIERVYLKECYTLYGSYEDMLGKSLNQNLTYTVGLYLWTAPKINAAK